MADLRRLFGGPEYAKLFRAARRRIEEEGIEAARSMTLEALSGREREALAELCGLKRLPGARFRVDLRQLDEALRASRAEAGLGEVIEALNGPLRDRRSEKAAERAAEERLWARARETLGPRPPLLEWLDEMKRMGLLRRAAHASGIDEAGLLKSALGIVARLPAAGTALAVLAAEETGDAHALDAGRPLGGLVLRAAAKLVGRSALPGGSAERRKLWEDVGITCDPLSAHALVMGLRPVGDGHLERFLRESAEAAEPVKLTLSQVARRALTIPSGEVIRVCENPSVVAVAAERLGARCPALVCTEGVPSTAVMTLLEGLRRGGASIRFHGDFDWGGLRIGNELFSRFGAVPWRFSAVDYRQAVAAGLGSPSLSGPPSVARWDNDLEAALRQADQAVHEETVVDCLVGDMLRVP